MSAIILRIIIYAAIAWFVYAGVRRLFRDLKGQFSGPPPAPPRGPDLRQSTPPDVIDLTRDSDGVYRPPGNDKRR